MRILGIGLSHCCGVCLIEDERIVFAQEEDRFSRRRRHKGWPERSLRYLLEHFGLAESDIDLCVLSDVQTAELLGKRLNARRTILVHHHLAHVMSGWALAPWSDFDAVSIDGGGDLGSWESFGAVRDRKLVRWESNCGSRLAKGNVVRRGLLGCPKTGHTFGSYWSVPSVINFGLVDRHGVAGYEGKLMGLAGWGDADAFDSRQAEYDAEFELKRYGDYHYVVTHGHPKIGSKHLCRTSDGRELTFQEVRRLRKQEKVIVSEYDLDKVDDRRFAANFGALLQRRTNRILLDLFAANFTPEMPVVVSGGTFSNVVTNGLLNQRYRFLVTPPMGDDGLALGAAAWGAYLKGVERLECPGMTLGFDAGSNAEVDPAMVADALVNKEIVGLIEGRMEFGPRALGARSILSDAQDNHANWTINERLGRVEYMPFAPVIMEEHAAEVLVGWRPEHLSARHMTLTYHVNPAWAKKLEGVVHVDGTVRPQVLGRQENRVYYDILREYFKRTGIPVLINTSFNAHGEPMLRTVEHGLQALREGRIDLLVAGNRVHRPGDVHVEA